MCSLVPDYPVATNYRLLNGPGGYPALLAEALADYQPPTLTLIHDVDRHIEPSSTLE